MVKALVVACGCANVMTFAVHPHRSEAIRKTSCPEEEDQIEKKAKVMWRDRLQGCAWFGVLMACGPVELIIQLAFWSSSVYSSKEDCRLIG